MGLDFFKCEHCGNIVIKAYNKGVLPMCCGQKMMLLSANTEDAATEKHVPVVQVDGGKVHVEVGEVLHPMTNEHQIAFICLETKQGFQVKELVPEDAPIADFAFIERDCPVKVYEYCNLHGLWAASI